MRSGGRQERLDSSGALDGNCRDTSDVDNPNACSRSRCDGDRCAYRYDLYFEKDQAVPGLEPGDLRRSFREHRAEGRPGTSRSIRTCDETSPSRHRVCRGVHPVVAVMLYSARL
ncbi:NPP1 family protein [Prauserella isguenensis]|uniref:NPP1 family protein n=1 Tax=Prauserella isguenensis TaxID=1470180 RepID=UPI0031B5D5D6